MKHCTYCNKYVAKYYPRNGCTACWDKYFQVRATVVVEIWKHIQEQGQAIAVLGLGKEVVKQLTRYMRAKDAKDFEGK